MSQAHASSALTMAVGRICYAIGWDAVMQLTMEQLVSVTEHFLREITRHMVRCSELNNRSESNLDDLAYAFRMLDVKLEDLRSYTDNVEFLPPPSKRSRVCQPKPQRKGRAEIAKRGGQGANRKQKKNRR